MGTLNKPVRLIEDFPNAAARKFKKANHYNSRLRFRYENNSEVVLEISGANIMTR